MITPVFFGNVERGRAVFADPSRLSLWLSTIEGQEFQCVIEKKKKKRSNRENGYYWAVIIPILSEHFGYSKNETHEALKHQFLLVHPEGKPPYAKSTTKLSTVEMEDYLSKIRMTLSMDWELDIPEPNEVDYRI